MVVRGDAVQDLAAELRSWLTSEQLDEIYSVKGSSGLSNNSRVPWVRIFQPAQSPDPTKGWYIVLLFSADGSSVYLSLNLGVSNLKPLEIEQQASFVKELLSQDLSQRSDFLESINLADRGLGAKYEKGNVAAFEIKKNEGLSDQQISGYLTWLIALLEKLPNYNDGEKNNMSEPVGDELDALEQ